MKQLVISILCSVCVLITSIVVLISVNSSRASRDLRSEVVTLQTTQDSLSSRNSILERVVALDETVMTRYQKSVNSCRSATQSMIEGDYAASLVDAKDVGETEEDVEPMLKERQKLLQGTNAEML